MAWYPQQALVACKIHDVDFVTELKHLETLFEKFQNLILRWPITHTRARTHRSNIQAKNYW